jgi:ABC-2 type transport system permease protein
VVSIGLAMFISNFARRESHAMIAIPLILLPAFLLSGLIFPLEVLPKFLQILSYFFPLRFAISSLHGLLLYEKPFFSIKFDFLALIFYGIITLFLGSLTLKDRE